MLRKKGFTLIELMIVVVIIGLLAALAIPRFMKAAKKSKLTERKEILKCIWSAAVAYYESHGEYPVYHQFNNANTKNLDWVSYPDLIVDRPSGYPRFTYYMNSVSGDDFTAYAYAYAPDSWDASIIATNDLVIFQDGTMLEDAAPYDPE